MYKIIGGDGQTYGPISMEQLRAWQKENRVNGATLVQAEGVADWRPLSTLPEFVATQLPPQIRTGNDRAALKIPAGICGILLGSLGVHKFILGYTGAGVIMLLITLLTCGMGAMVTYVIGLVEGIIYLTKSDEDFVRTYVDGRKEWF